MTLQEEDEQSHTGTQEYRVDRPMGGINSVCVEESQCMIGNTQPYREDGPTRFEQHWRGNSGAVGDQVGPGPKGRTEGIEVLRGESEETGVLEGEA